MVEDCLKEIKCSICQQDHSAYARSCDVYKKEKEIHEVKHKRNVLSGSNQNSRDLNGRKHLRFYCAKDRYNLSRQQILSSRREIDPVGSKWLAKVSGAPEKKYNFTKYQLKKLRTKRNQMM